MYHTKRRQESKSSRFFLGRGRCGRRPWSVDVAGPRAGRNLAGAALRSAWKAHLNVLPLVLSNRPSRAAAPCRRAMRGAVAQPGEPHPAGHHALPRQSGRRTSISREPARANTSRFLRGERGRSRVQACACITRYASYILSGAIRQTSSTAAANSPRIIPVAPQILWPRQAI